MQHLKLGVGLFILSSIATTVTWLSTSPELMLKNETFRSGSRDFVQGNNAAFLYQMKAALDESVEKRSMVDRSLTDLSPNRTNVHLTGWQISKEDTEGNGNDLQNDETKIAVNLSKYTVTFESPSEIGVLRK